MGVIENKLSLDVVYFPDQRSTRSTQFVTRGLACQRISTCTTAEYLLLWMTHYLAAYTVSEYRTVKLREGRLIRD